jgi:hypothetical protein
MGRFPADLAVDIDVAIDYLNFFPRKANQSFDIIYLRFRRILEYYYVPSLGLEELINAL